MLSLTFILLLSYIVGSIPTSIIVSKMWRGIDIRDYGSGNAGASNVFRVLGWKAGVIVSVVDISKGAFATLVISSLRFDPLALEPTVVQILAGMSAVIGHIWTVFAGFRGGKGVATAAGMLLALQPVICLICLAIFLGIFLSTRYVSLASMGSALSFPILLFLARQVLHYPIHLSLLILGVALAALILFTHRSNIRRLLQGKENRARLPLPRRAG